MCRLWDFPQNVSRKKSRVAGNYADYSRIGTCEGTRDGRRGFGRCRVGVGLGLMLEHLLGQLEQAAGELALLRRMLLEAQWREQEALRRAEEAEGRLPAVLSRAA